MPAQENSTTTNAATDNHSGGNTLESLESWSAFFNGSVVVLTALLALAGYFAWKYSSDLTKLKDEELLRFQSDANVAIASADARASEANQKAAAANERAGKLELSARQLEQANLESQRKLEEERTTRLELERSLAPRQIPFLMNLKGESSTSNVDPLKPFAGMHVVIWFLPDAEARRAASNIAQLADFAGLAVIQPEPHPELAASFFDGVVIEQYKPPGTPGTPSTAEDRREMEKSNAAVAAFVGFLKSYDWEARIDVGRRGAIPPNTIKIQVGFKPAPYFHSKLTEKADKDLNKLRHPPPQP